MNQVRTDTISPDVAVRTATGSGFQAADLSAGGTGGVIRLSPGPRPDDTKTVVTATGFLSPQPTAPVTKN
jgi:hypothetical protein